MMLRPQGNYGIWLTFIGEGEDVTWKLSEYGITKSLVPGEEK